jgi:hypothetical protein
MGAIVSSSLTAGPDQMEPHMAWAVLLIGLQFILQLDL